MTQNTHDVFNQSPLLENYNMYASDTALSDLIQSHNLQWGQSQLSKLGAILGSTQWIDKGFHVNKFTPEFFSHGARGNRINEVQYHPAYHDLMKLAFEYQIPVLPWVSDKKGSHLLRMVLNYLYNQNEAGSACPLTMTFSSVPVIAKYSGDEKLLNKILNTNYDPSNQPLSLKTAVTIGMAMTEKQGGTDVQANTSTAVALNESATEFELTGHKWFCSAPMCDAFLTLAQTDAGLSCFLMPRWRPNGQLNSIYIQQLKDKMGNRSNASSEIEFTQAYAQLLGEQGKGVRTIIEMVALTRYDCMIGSSALMRQAVAQVTHHISHRKVFNKNLIDQPLMQNVVADLCLESHAALLMTVRIALSLDQQDNDDEQLLIRLLTAIGKYWICKRAVIVTGEAQECLGGIGYIEQNILARLYREAPVNSIWEGSGNVQCLDVLRVLKKTPKALAVYFNELESVISENIIYKNYVVGLKQELQNATELEYQARYFVEKLALAMQACQLIKSKNKLYSESFCQSRLEKNRGLVFGNLPLSIDCKSIINYAKPNLNQ